MTSQCPPAWIRLIYQGLSPQLAVRSRGPSLTRPLLPRLSVCGVSGGFPASQMQWLNCYFWTTDNWCITTLGSISAYKILAHQTVTIAHWCICKYPVFSFWFMLIVCTALGQARFQSIWPVLVFCIAVQVQMWYVCPATYSTVQVRDSSGCTMGRHFEA